MIIYSLCNTCLQPFNLIIETVDVHLVKQITDEDGTCCPCPRLCGGNINLVGDTVISDMGKSRMLRDPLTLTGQQLYQAVSGLGMPDEVPTTVDTVDSFLRGNPVVKTVLEEKNGAIYLHELHLQSGLVVHLASGLRGAQVLKITKESNHGP